MPNITPEQIQADLSGSAALSLAARALHDFGVDLKTLQDNNWITNVTFGGIQIPVTVDSATQTALTAQYAVLKSNAVNAYNTLP